MRDRFPLALVGGLLLLGVLGSFLLRGAARGSFAGALSTYRSEPDGSRALYLLAEQSGIEVGRIQQSLEIIDQRQNPVLLAVQRDPAEGEEDPLPVSPDAGSSEEDRAEEELRRGWNRFRILGITEEERANLLEHVKKGATLLFVPWGHEQDPLLHALNVTQLPPGPAPGVRTLVPAQPTPYTLGVERVEAQVQAFLDLPGEAVPLLLDDRLGEVVGAIVPYGQGRVIVIGAPELAENQALSRADNAQLWVSLLGQMSLTGKVAFDEFHHGFTSNRSVAELAARHGLHFAVAQLLLGLMLWAGSLRRFGRLQQAAEDLRLESTDALCSASRLYREGKHFAYAAGLIARGLSQELAPHAGLPWRSEPAEVAQALSARGRGDLAAPLTEAIQREAAVTSDSQLTQLARLSAEARRRLSPRRNTLTTFDRRPATAEGSVRGPESARIPGPDQRG